MADKHKPTIDQKAETIKIKVNRKPVIMNVRKATGLQIKQAAIDQGVEIQIDFLLSVKTEKGGWKRVLDDKSIVLNENHRIFRAVDGDDNS